MATLQQVVEQFQDEMRSIAGIRKAPDKVPDSINAFPFVVCYPQDGDYSLNAPGQMKGIHTLVIELHVSRNDLPRDYTAAMTYAEKIPNELFDAFRDGTLTTISTFTNIRYEFGVLDWGETKTLGFRFYVEGVKKLDTIT